MFSGEGCNLKRNNDTTPPPPGSPGSVGFRSANSPTEPPQKRPRHEEGDGGPSGQHQRLYADCVAQGQARAHFGDTRIQQQNIQNFSCNHVPHQQTQSPGEKIAFVKALAFDSMESRVANIRSPLMNTCSWLFDTPEYIRWRNLEGGSGFLWVKGNPGSGKSTLMKCALDHAKSTFRGEHVISFFFNARGYDLEKSTEGMYRSLLHQMLQALPRLRAGFPVYGPSNAKEQGWQINTLVNYFRQAVQGLTDSELVTCYIDALDECPEDEIREALGCFEDLDYSPSRFRVLFSSRHYPRITLKRCAEMNLDVQKWHLQDILVYLQEKLSIQEAAFKARLISQIQSRCAGAFFWVVFVVRKIMIEYDRGATEQKIQGSLDTIPTQIEDLLSGIVERPDDALVTTVIWVLFAKQPLELKALYFAIRISIGDLEQSVWDPNEIGLSGMKRFLSTSSRGLVECASQNRTTQFIHESVRQYFLTVGLERLCPDFVGKSRELRHYRMAQWCQWYVHLSWGGEQSQALSMHSNDFDTTVRTLERYPFLSKALSGTFYYMESAFVGSVKHIGQLQDFPVTAYIQFINRLSPSRDGLLQTHSLGLVYLLIVKGAESIVTALLERITSGIVEHETLDFNIACGGRHGYVLLAAVSAGYLTIARILLEHGADANVISSRKETSLGIAING